MGGTRGGRMAGMPPASVSESLRKNYADYYDQDESFTEWRRLGARDKAANIVALCGDMQSATVLDVGCGDGAIIEFMCSGGHWDKATTTGLEISPSAIRALEEKGIRAQIFDGSVIPFPDAHFDLVVLSHVIEHAEHPRQLLYEARRVGRKIFVEVPLEDNSRLSEDFVADKVGHINFYNVKTIRRLVQSCGLEIIDTKLSHSSLAAYTFRLGRQGTLNYWIKETLLRVNPSFAARHFTYHYSILAVAS